MHQCLDSCNYCLDSCLDILLERVEFRMEDLERFESFHDEGKEELLKVLRSLRTKIRDRLFELEIGQRRSRTNQFIIELIDKLRQQERIYNQAFIEDLRQEEEKFFSS